MISNSKLFYSYKLSSGCKKVSIADGTKVSIAGHSSVVLLNKYYANDMLHVNLSLNLLSVSKITKELQCSLIFSSDRCVMQVLVTGMKIEISLVGNGLYRLPSVIGSTFVFDGHNG